MRVLVLVLVILIVASSTAWADDEAVHQAAYVELLGRGGAYGVGYEIALAERLAVGAAASFVAVDGERVTTVSPYLHGVIVERGAHAWFADAGPALTHVAIPSPVAEWNGVSSTSIGGIVTTGY